MSIITCADCGALYDQSVVVSSDVWERISDDGAYMLCFDCMDRRMVARGLTALCDIVRGGKALRTRAETPLWRPKEMIFDPLGGHPALYSRQEE